MPFTPETPFPKSKGHPLRSKDWNQLVNEVRRLDTAKASRIDADTLKGPLSVSESLGIGVGPAATKAPLHIAGGNWDVGGTEGDLRIGSDTTRFKIGVALAGNGAGDVRLRSVGGTNRLMLGSNTEDTLTIQNGRVGIGTITPNSSAKLDLRGALFVDSILAIQARNEYHSARHRDESNYGYFEGRTRSGKRGFYLGWGKPGDYVDLRLESGNDLAIRGGNVGIGTHQPGAPLHVISHMAVGPFAATGGTGGIDVSGSSAEFGFVRRNLSAWPSTAQAGDRFVWYNPDGTAHLWTHRSGNLLTIDKSGNISYRGRLTKIDVQDKFSASIRCADLRIGHSTRSGRLKRALVDATNTLNLNHDGDWSQGVRWGGAAMSRQSSRELKENISEISPQEALEKLQGLTPVKFQLKADTTKTTCLGFIAEDSPEDIATADHKAIVDGHIVAILTRLVKDQQAVIERLSTQIQALEKTVTAPS